MADIEGLLSELARAVQRYGMYPEGHPARTSTAAEVHDRLLELLRTEEAVNMRVTGDRIVCGGIETDPDSALLSGFARRVHSHQLHQITLRAGITTEELAGLLGVLAEAAGAVGEPFGASAPEVLARWPHIDLEPVPYADLRLARGSEEDDDEDQTGDVLAGSGRGGEAGEGGPGGTGDAGESELQRQIAGLLDNLDSGARDRLREAFQTVMKSEGVGGIPERAVARLIERVRSSGGQDRAAATMLGLISRLGKSLAGEGSERRVSPGEVLGELVGQLEGRTGEGDPSGGVGEGFETVEAVWVGPIEPERVLRLGVELAEISPAAQRSMKTLVAEARAGTVADILEAAPEDNAGAGEIREWIGRPKNLQRLMAGESPDLDAVDRLIRIFGSAAAPALLATLVDATQEDVRGELARRLIALGGEVGPLAVERLEEPDPRVRGAMLSILSRIDPLPENFHPSSFYLDDDRGVRRQALEFGLQLDDERERVLYTALRDPDPDIVSFALTEIARDCPPDLVSRLIRMATDRREPAAMRRAGIRALAYADSPEVLSALIELTWQRRFFVIYALAPKSSEMLEALEILVRNWASNSRVRRIVAAARKSKDPQIKAVATRSGPRPTSASETGGDRTDGAGRGQA